MKSTRFLILAVLSLNFAMGCNGKKPVATAQASESAKAELPAEEEPTAVLAPVETTAGPAAQATIGSRGGSLQSADGKIDVAFPPGAVYNDTQVSVQPINNDDLDGIGPGYRLSPEGTQFNAPVMLTWHLSESDLSGHTITEATIATRDENQTWRAQRGVKYDADAKVVRIATNHFSPWKATWVSYLPDLVITPSQDDVPVNKKTSLRATIGPPPPPLPSTGGTGNPKSDDDLLFAPKGTNTDDDLLAAPGNCAWRVNGKAGGNATYGFIEVTDEVGIALYTAPSKVPARNPVTVSCERKTGHAKVLAISSITITDKRGWNLNVSYGYSDSHSNTGLTVAHEMATAWGAETREANASFHVYADSRYGGGAVGGMGKGTVTVTTTGGMKNSICHAGDETVISGPASAEGNGVTDSGTLSVSIHGDLIHGHLHHEDTCGKGVRPDQDWDTASSGVACNFTGIDFVKGGSFQADVPSDNGKGKCKVTITPE